MANFQAVTIGQICREIKDIVDYWRDIARSAYLTKLERVDVFNVCSDNIHALSRLHIEGDSFRISLYADKIQEACLKLDIDMFSLLIFLLSHELAHFIVHVEKIETEIEEAHCDTYALSIMDRNAMSRSAKDIRERMLSLRNYEM